MVLRPAATAKAPDKGGVPARGMKQAGSLPPTRAVVRSAKSRVSLKIFEGKGRWIGRGAMQTLRLRIQVAEKEGRVVPGSTGVHFTAPRPPQVI